MSLKLLSCSPDSGDHLMVMPHPNWGLKGQKIQGNSWIGGGLEDDLSGWSNSVAAAAAAEEVVALIQVVVRFVKTIQLEPFLFGKRRVESVKPYHHA